jgi:hypothetical protein
LQQFIQSVRERVDVANGLDALPVLLTSAQNPPFVRSMIERSFQGGHVAERDPSFGAPANAHQV